ncbi:putative terminase large subunit [uncultured virus]|uniref:Putative terminase large subunit n=1 Tax=uncultured virus TaxID=340016 RepID=A0A218MMM9_9VIRU|nr:putative terminase large subunit [uncultured virus]
MQLEGLDIDINKLPAEARKEFLRYKIKLEEKRKESAIKNDFMSFVKYVWPDFIEGSHHKIMSEKFNKVATGQLKRVIINMAPRHTKSEFSSYLLPSWMIGKNPKLKIIQATHTTELAVRFGRKAKNLIDSQEYQKIFQTKLREDSKAAGRWETNEGGEYFAAGVGGSITGRGADLLIIDDPHSEQDALNTNALERTWEWYTSGPRQRLQPGGVIVVVMTRWNTKDLTGKLINAQKETKADQWEVIEFPAILPNEKPLWPEYWKLEELEGVKASLAIGKWNAQYQQNPTAEEGSIIKREWWNLWDKDLPPLYHVIQSYDTAFLKKETADYSAITTWGVFYPTEDSGPNLILLDVVKDRFEFPELRRVALEQYNYWKPESVIVEGKASGMPLTFELRKQGIPVINYTPSRGNDKHARVNAVAPLFESGQIWATDDKFSEEVIEECAAFPYGDHDDLVDSMTQAVMRFRQGGFIEHPDDEQDDPLPQQQRVYY